MLGDQATTIRLLVHEVDEAAGAGFDEVVPVGGGWLPEAVERAVGRWSMNRPGTAAPEPTRPAGGGVDLPWGIRTTGD